MAYPSGAEIRGLLPADDPVVTSGQCQAFVDEWVSLVQEAAGNPATPVETAASRRIVRRGAWADAMEQLMTVSGYVGDPEAVMNTRQWAEKALATFDATHSTPAEVSAESPTVFLAEVPW